MADDPLIEETLEFGPDIDNLGYQEHFALKKGRDLESEADESQHGRRENVRDRIAFLLLIWLIAAGGIIIATTLVWSWHLLVPTSYRWLTPTELSDIKELFTGVAIGAIFGIFIKDRYF